MKPYQEKFIELTLQHQALRFGEFKLKSGRISPYFFNVGLLQDGKALKTLGECYAQAIVDANIAFDVLFGPAYKGIPLVCASAIAIASQRDQNVPYAFNRKEAKDHGEGGNVIGAPLNSRVLILDDVITAGTAMRESLQLIAASSGKVAGIIVALDRQEKGQGHLSAIQEIQQAHALPVKSIITLEHIMAFVKNNPEFAEFEPALIAYRQQYGVS